MIKLGIIMLCLLGCGSIPTDWERITGDFRAQGGGYATIKGQEQALLPYILAFEVACGVSVRVSVGFVPQELPVVGKCVEWTINDVVVDRQVEIDGQWWKQASSSAREWLMFHELGHCVLHLPHGGQGYMKETFGNTDLEDYENKREDLIKELCPTSRKG